LSAAENVAVIAKPSAIRMATYPTKVEIDITTSLPGSMRLSNDRGKRHHKYLLA